MSKGQNLLKLTTLLQPEAVHSSPVGSAGSEPSKLTKMNGQSDLRTIKAKTRAWWWAYLHVEVQGAHVHQILDLEKAKGKGSACSFTPVCYVLYEAQSTIPGKRHSPRGCHRDCKALRHPSGPVDRRSRKRSLKQGHKPLGKVHRVHRKFCPVAAVKTSRSLFSSQWHRYKPTVPQCPDRELH